MATTQSTTASEEQVRETFRSRIAAKMKAGWSRTKRFAMSVGSFFSRTARATGRGVAKGARSAGRGTVVGLRFAGVGIAKGLSYLGLFITFGVRAVVAALQFVLTVITTVVVAVVYGISVVVIGLLGLIARIAQGVGLLLATPNTLRTPGATRFVWKQWLKSFKLNRSFKVYPHTIAFDRDLAASLAWELDGERLAREAEEGQPLPDYVSDRIMEATAEIFQNDPMAAMEMQEAFEDDEARKGRRKGRPTAKQRPRRPRRTETQTAEAV